VHQKFILIGLVSFCIIVPSSVFAQLTNYSTNDPGAASQFIPPWIKNTAGWWATGNITENEFLRAIQYLIENNIIKITATKAQNLPDITTTYTLPASRQTEYAKIQGAFEEKHQGPLTLTIIHPDKSQEVLTTISRDGKFTATMALSSNSQIGAYQVYAEIKGEEILVSAFEVKDRNANKIPVWIKNNAEWWSQGKITDNDFIKGIEFLVENGIILVQVMPQEKPVEVSEFQQECGGDARCITGKVTGVVDGDTIKVNDQSIRFTLASAPELDQPFGIEARQFIDKICPIGSLVLVDEDDGQVDGSFGRVIAVIYCNDRNLNSELLDANLGYLSTEFCPKSEFSGTTWAQKHGCSVTESSQDTPITTENCDQSYPDVCIPSPPPDLNCADITYRNFKVIAPDPHNFDGDKNGIGCEKQ